LEHHHNIKTHNNVQHHHCTIIRIYGTIKDLSIIHCAEIIKVTEKAIEEVVMEEEDLEEVEDQ
jgi:hypothetical protein